MINIHKNNINILGNLVDNIEYLYINIDNRDFYTKQFVDVIRDIIDNKPEEDRILNIHISCDYDNLKIINKNDPNYYLSRECNMREMDREIILTSIKIIDMFGDILKINDDFFDRRTETRLDIDNIRFLSNSSHYAIIENNEDGLYLFSYIFNDYNNVNDSELKINLIYNV